MVLILASKVKGVKAPEEKAAPSLYEIQEVKAHAVWLSCLSCIFNYHTDTTFQEELQLLQKGKASESTDHEMRTAPLITCEAFIAGEFQEWSTQYGVLRETLSIQQVLTV